ncbi:hypothetical protein FHS30_002659 [Simiduia aestuariiviva]|uniref:Uncharacterized protein n=1 Tax=Simiduia aestuariiviva TaxID=1510459 RepID=A0A839URW5_9GAMM|nr:hypothetical protein [Simiduia aestuariiviva]
MNRAELALVAIYFTSAVFGVVSAQIFSYEHSLLLAFPALAISGFAAFGHFITLDDDMPGEWSNPEGSKEIWHESLRWLAIKVVAFIVPFVLVKI